MDNLYKNAMREQLRQLQEELSEIQTMLVDQGYLSSIAYRAAERNLQLLVEACIGITKQTLKAKGLEVPSDARQSFAKLKSLGLDPTDIPWTKVVGMRNALVHDYLNLDPERISEVIANGHYLKLFKFALMR
ncbi:type VII toxin-antitoxin system HepT family RNase toxin, partial [Nitrincola nitratireducens]|uniref:type VII toxin-antitoxin system HepT family RNase toxin n=1 Tax=Nitrincola nitratireducens TaxID=1229521 RepID=UPI000561002B